MASEPIHENKPEERLSVKLRTQRDQLFAYERGVGDRVAYHGVSKLEGNIFQWIQIANNCIIGTKKGLSKSMNSKSSIKPRIPSLSHGQTHIVRTVR